MNLHNIAAKLRSTGARTLVVFAYASDKKLSFDAKGVGADQTRALVTKAGEDGRFKGAAKETVFFRSCGADGFDHVLAVGLGERKEINETSLRTASAVMVKTLSREKITAAEVALATARRLTKDAIDAGRAFSEGALLGSYKYDELKSKPKDKKEKSSHKSEDKTEEKRELADIHFVLDDKMAAKKFLVGVEQGKILAECTNFARDLGNSPGNYLTPAHFGDRVGAAVKGLPVKYHALGKKEIQALKMGCLLGVNKGSAEEPRFLVLEYHGGKKSDKPFVLVGKGLTFDTGGISIKPSAAMEEMKFDMCGGAAVVGAFLALVKLKVKVNVVCLVPSTENMPGGNAVKPGDVLVAMNGKTVEVNNTDAEGRLILADALSYACEKYEPKAIIDAATLTGACVVALGNVFSGVFTKDESFFKKIQASSAATGERLWRLPLVDEYLDDMKGTYGDLSNVSSGKGGGASQGAAFLSQFVKDEITWAHFDIAGVAYNTGNRVAYNSDKGASGFAVRLFTELIMNS